MRKIIRKPENTPDCLAKEIADDGRTKTPTVVVAQKLYTQKWINNGHKAAKWTWYNNVNKELEPLLKEMTQKHCSFCDALNSRDS